MMPGMFESMNEMFNTLIERGGPVMWPLGALSLVGLTLIFERAWFFAVTNNGARRRRMTQIAKHLRQGQAAAAVAMSNNDDSIYGDLVRQLTAEKATDAAATDAVERQRPKLERFMPTLGTIITAAPMLGILGTVLGIIQSFDFLSQRAADPLLVSGGVARALITTASGLVISLVVIFPYNFFRARIRDRLDSLEQEGRHLLSRERAATKRFKAS